MAQAPILRQRTAITDAARRTAALRRAVRAITSALDKLAPPPPSDHDPEPPPAWFRYPPI